MPADSRYPNGRVNSATTRRKQPGPGYVAMGRSRKESVHGLRLLGLDFLAVLFVFVFSAEDWPWGTALLMPSRGLVDFSFALLGALAAAVCRTLREGTVASGPPPPRPDRNS